MPPMVGSAIVGSRGQARDRMQEIVGVNVSADFASRRRGLEKRPKGGAEPLIKIRGQCFEGRVSRVQGRSEPSFGSNKGCISLHPLR